MSPIDCERVLKEIELFLDGELVGSLELEVERHLGRCGPCSDHADFQLRLKKLLRSKCGCDEMPPEILERVRSLLDRTHPPTP